jgi:hypothetical protein
MFAVPRPPATALIRGIRDWLEVPSRANAMIERFLAVSL